MHGSVIMVASAWNAALIAPIIGWGEAGKAAK
jgi:hypothetical protein